MVVVMDSSLPRNCWPRGLITKADVAPDGQVRTATVRTAYGEYVRPAVKLIPLMQKEESPQKDDQGPEARRPTPEGAEAALSAANE